MKSSSRAVLFALGLACLSCGDNPMAPEGQGEAAKQKKKEAQPSGPVVLVGLDQLDADKGGALKGKKVGLVAHGASVSDDGRRSVDVLRDRGVEVVRLFAPEHGFKGTLAAGEKVADAVDPETKLPVVSLYGARSKPRLEDLKGLDALVFDLQDAGVRFYSYISTLLLCLEAAAEADIELVVLDRPNPLGGERVEGPLRDDEMATSMLSMAPGPLVHGLTSGEMARLVNAQRPKPARLTVVPMKGWKRTMTWAGTGRAWVPPSPNLVSADAALAYPGVALLEATNVSEGRGTDMPFLLLGAPWVKPEALLPAVSVPGFTLETAAFTPVPGPAAPDPKHAGSPCAGVRIGVKDAALVRPYSLGIALLHGLRRQPGFELLKKGAALDRLVGTPKLRLALERGDTPEMIVAADAAAHEAFKKERTKALLY